MAMTFREALISRVAPNGPPLKAVADATGVSYEQLKKVKQGHTQSTNADDAVKVAAYFGLTLNEFMDDDLTEDRAAVAAIYSSLTPEEVRIVRDLGQARSGRDRDQGI